MTKGMFKERLMEIARRQKSVNDFSRKCGISNSLMISYLNGKSLPGLENLLKMAAAAQVSVQWLASGLGPVAADAEMLKSGRQREEAARRLAMVEKWVEGARVLAGQRISPNLLRDIHSFAYLNNLGQEQTADLVLKWGSAGRQDRSLDYELLRQVVRTVEELLEEACVMLPLEKKADIIALVYESSLGDGTGAIDKTRALKLINLAR